MLVGKIEVAKITLDGIDLLFDLLIICQEVVA